MRREGKERRPRILPVCKGGATQPSRMQRRPNSEVILAQALRVVSGRQIYDNLRGQPDELDRPLLDVESLEAE